MRIFWQGTDITEHVKIEGCVHQESSDGESDLLDLTMRGAASWHRWAPETDDRVRVVHKGYDTGTLYLTAAWAAGDRYRVLASSLRAGAAGKKWAGYRNKTLNELMVSCAAEYGMSAGIYGISGGILYPWLTREGEGGAAFLNRILAMEGTALKCVGGAMRAIYIPWAQKREPQIQIAVNVGNDGATWRLRENEKWGRTVIRGPYGTGWATDTAAAGRPEKVITGLPAMDDVTARRWAMGMLLSHNRKAETLEVEMDLNGRFQAMERVTVNGNTGAWGEWIIDKTEHDLVNEKTRAEMLRCVDTIL